MKSIALHRKDIPDYIVPLFWSKVDVRGPNECWDWKGTIVRSGYGQFGFDHRYYRPQRIAYVLTTADIPQGLCACHKCDNRKCCNPVHVFIGTLAENNQDRVAKGRDGNHKGMANGRAILTDDNVREIRKMTERGHTIREIAQTFLVTPAAIRFIVNGIHWRHVT